MRSLAFPQARVEIEVRMGTGAISPSDVVKGRQRALEGWNLLSGAMRNGRIRSKLAGGPHYPRQFFKDFHPERSRNSERKRPSIRRPVPRCGRTGTRRAVSHVHPP